MCKAESCWVVEPIKLFYALNFTVRHNSNASGQLSLPPPYPAENAVHTAHPHPQAGQFVWYILKSESADLLSWRWGYSPRSLAILSNY